MADIIIAAQGENSVGAREDNHKKIKVLEKCCKERNIVLNDEKNVTGLEDITFHGIADILSMAYRNEDPPHRLRIMNICVNEHNTDPRLAEIYDATKVDYTLQLLVDAINTGWPDLELITHVNHTSMNRTLSIVL